MGRLATRIALVLQGKHKPIFTPGADCGDYVVVTNARHVIFTGDKWRQKGYYRHSGYPGGLSRVPAKDMLERQPTEIIKKAVWGMLPKNRLRKDRIARLKIYPDAEHPYKANIHRSYEEKPQMEASI